MPFALLALNASAAVEFVAAASFSAVAVAAAAAA